MNAKDNTVRFKVVIPARYASTRLPGKPLRLIAGEPMIAHVCKRAQEAHAESVIVATDDERIANVVTDLGIQAVMTRSDHQSGTERIAEVARLCGWDDETLVVNVQGDEPLIPPQSIRNVALTLAEQQHAGIATLASIITHTEDIFNPNTVKVVVNKQGHALYFSRAAIPWDRDRFAQNAPPSGKMPYLRHIGLYAYTVGFLKRYCQWPASILETIESLEQLRILWHGEAIAVKTIEQAPPAGVDTEDDLQRVEQILTTNIKHDIRSS